MNQKKRRLSRLALIGLATIAGLSLLTVLVVLAAPGDLDPTFDGDGIAITNVLNEGNDAALAAAIQADGKILAAGFTADGTANRLFALARYNPDGSLDTGLDGDGTLWTSLDLNNNTNARQVLLQPDDKIVLVGGGGQFYVTRYHPDGSLDSAFDTDGKASASFAGFAEAFDGAFQGDKILAAGSTGIGASEDIAIARFTAAGAPDATFDSDGKLTLDLNGQDERASAVAVQPDDKIVIAGFASNGADFDFMLARFEISGTLDASFGVNGVVTTTVGAGNDMLNTLAVQPDGKILAGGEAFNGTDRDFALARYNADGTLDAAFGTGGVVMTDIGGFDDRSFGLALQADGKIVLVGGASNGSDTDVAVVRYNTDGGLDSGFGSGGIVITPIGGGDDWGRDVAIQPDSKLIVVGSTDTGIRDDYLVLRYGTNGAPIADAGPPQTVWASDLVTLDGSGSSDPDGHIPLAYGWQQTGGVTVTLSDAASISPTFTAPLPGGVLTFTLVVTDSLGLAGPADTVTVTVEAFEIFAPVVSKNS